MGRPGQLEQREAMDLRALQEPLEATGPQEQRELVLQGRLAQRARLEQTEPLEPQGRLEAMAQLEQLAKLEQPDLLGLREPLVLALRALRG